MEAFVYTVIVRSGSEMVPAGQYFSRDSAKAEAAKVGGRVIKTRLAGPPPQVQESTDSTIGVLVFCSVLFTIISTIWMLVIQFAY